MAYAVQHPKAKLSRILVPMFVLIQMGIIGGNFIPQGRESCNRRN